MNRIYGEQRLGSVELIWQQADVLKERDGTLVLDSPEPVVSLRSAKVTMNDGRGRVYDFAESDGDLPEGYWPIVREAADLIEQERKIKFLYTEPA